jgi:hypothetical protein
MGSCLNRICFYRHICRSHIDSLPYVKVPLSDVGIPVACLHALVLIGFRNNELHKINNDPRCQANRHIRIAKTIRLEQKLGGFEQCFTF